MLETTFKPAYIERKELNLEALSTCLSSALDDTGCTEKQIDLKAHRILAKAVHGDYKILCWWASVQEEVINDCRPMHTEDKENATLLGICAFPRTGKSADGDAVSRINTRIKERMEHYLQSVRTVSP